LQRKRQTGDTAAEDEKIKLLHRIKGQSILSKILYPKLHCW
jgi:hypothetical protein